MTKVNHYLSHDYNGDELSWEFFKYVVFSSFLFSYYGRKTLVRVTYPSSFFNAEKMRNFFCDNFEIAYEFDFFLDDEVQYKSHKLSYLDKASKSKEPLLYISDNIAPTSRFDFIANDTIKFLDEQSQDSKYSQAYNNIGVYDRVFDDRIIYVPKYLCGKILEDILRIKKDFGFNDQFIDNIVQFVIQTHALIKDIPIETIGKENFTEINLSNAMFLSNCSSVTFGKDQ